MIPQYSTIVKTGVKSRNNPMVHHIRGEKWRAPEALARVMAEQ
jgi:hypothetical protein|tara:strand:- start:57 stop:185 length:129 start_codon:yes stop_codon:yes gene_type:complete